MQFDREKLKTVILYAVHKCGSDRLGAVKLHKTLYFTDMLHYADVGTPVTGATYRKRPLGPTCDALLPILRDMEREGLLEIAEADYFGYRKKQFIPKSGPELNRLSESELALLDEVIEFVCFDNSAKTISEFSHNRAWELAEFGDVLPYRSVFHIFPNQVSEDTLEWAAEQAQAVEAERSKGDPVDYADFATLRKRLLEAGRV